MQYLFFQIRLRFCFDIYIGVYGRHRLFPMASTMERLAFLCMLLPLCASVPCFDRYDSVANINGSLVFFKGKLFASDDFDSVQNVSDHFGINFDYVNAVYVDKNKETFVISGNVYQSLDNEKKAGRLDLTFGIEENVNAVLVYSNYHTLYFTDFYVSDGVRRRSFADMFHPRPFSVVGAYYVSDREIALVTKDWSCWIYEIVDDNEDDTSVVHVDPEVPRWVEKFQKLERNDREHPFLRRDDLEIGSLTKKWTKEVWVLSRVVEINSTWKCPSDCRFDSVSIHSQYVIAFKGEHFFVYYQALTMYGYVLFLNGTLPEAIYRAFVEARSLEAQSVIRIDYRKNKPVADLRTNDEEEEEAKKMKKVIKIDAFFEMNNYFWLISGPFYVQTTAGPKEWNDVHGDDWLVRRGLVRETFGVDEQVNAAVSFGISPFDMVGLNYSYLLFTDRYMYTNLGKKHASYIFKNPPDRAIVGSFAEFSDLCLIAEDEKVWCYFPFSGRKGLSFRRMTKFASLCDERWFVNF